MKNEKNLREAHAIKLLFTMSLPVVFFMLIQVVYNMADVFFLGRTGSNLAVAAVSLSSPVFSVFSALNTLAGFGGCTAISLALGKGDRESIKKYSSFVLYFGLFSGMLLGTAALLFMNQLLSLLGTNAETVELARDYLRIMAFNAPFAISAGALANAARADGESKAMVIAGLSGTFLNIVLDPVLISVLDLGVAGAGYATLLGNVLSFFMILISIKKKEGLSISIKDFSMKPEISVKVLSLGVPMAVSTFLMSFSSTFANRLMVSYGNDAVAVGSVAGKAGMLIVMLVMGIAMGIQPAISYAYGAGLKDRVKELVTVTGMVNVAVAVVLSASIFIMRDSFIGVFLADEASLTLGRRMILGSVLAAPFSAVYQLCSVYLQATGKVKEATITALLQKFAVYVPVLYIMNMMFSLNGLIFAGLVTDAVSTSAAAGLCVRKLSKIRTA